MSTEEILVRKDGSIAWIILNRPEKRNAQGVSFTPSMLAALDRVESDADVAVAVLTGAGPVFGGGGDLKEIMSVDQQDPEWELELIRGYNRVVSRIYYFDRPIIAAVNGPAVGGGACLALACDFAIASDAAEYRLAFARIGLSGADMGAPFLLQRHLGAARAARYLLCAARIGAEEGRALGLFAEVVSPDRLEQTVRQVALEIASQSRRATSITKLALRRSAEAGLDASLEYEAYLQSFAFRSEGHKHRLGAFLGKGCNR
ncbi:MAG: enoyl-CoA hydratase/isomerase family protein [Hyphomicrobiaceae bacterium]|nr:enoyl-CoA hydratase/isomerase family protein [Hyphomicrobiaceae bacterium]